MESHASASKLRSSFIYLLQSEKGRGNIEKANLSCFMSNEDLISGLVAITFVYLKCNIVPTLRKSKGEHFSLFHSRYSMWGYHSIS